MSYTETAGYVTPARTDRNVEGRRGWQHLKGSSVYVASVKYCSEADLRHGNGQSYNAAAIFLPLTQALLPSQLQYEVISRYLLDPN